MVARVRRLCFTATPNTFSRIFSRIYISIQNMKNVWRRAFSQHRMAKETRITPVHLFSIPVEQIAQFSLNYKRLHMYNRYKMWRIQIIRDMKENSCGKNRCNTTGDDTEVFRDAAEFTKVAGSNHEMGSMNIERHHRFRTESKIRGLTPQTRERVRRAVKILENAMNHGGSQLKANSQHTVNA